MNPLRNITAILAVLLACSTSVFADPVADPSADSLRISGSLGLNLWDELGDLDPVLPGDFESTGAALELSLHGGGWQFGPGRLYAGADLGFFGNSSDVEGVFEREDLQASMVYFTPSLRMVFGERGRLRWLLDAGAGYYDVSVDEAEDDCFWDCDTYEYFDDSTFGGYLGLGLEFPLGKGGRSLGFTAGARVHFVDFDDPADLAATGNLDGPIYVLYAGLVFYR